MAAVLRSVTLPAGVAVLTMLVAVGGYWLVVRDAAEHDVAIDSELAALGAEVYVANCAACHGPEGEGAPDWQTPDEDGRLPPPPHDSTGHTWHHADGLLFRIVRDGCGVYTDPERCAMPAFGDRLSDREIRAVIEFLKTWWGPEELEFQRRVSERDPYP